MRNNRHVCFCGYCLDVILTMSHSFVMEDAANPWSPSSAYIQVGSLQNILVFAEKSGHIDKVSFWVFVFDTSV